MNIMCCRDIGMIAMVQHGLAHKGRYAQLGRVSGKRAPQVVARKRPNLAIDYACVIMQVSRKKMAFTCIAQSF